MTWYHIDLMEGAHLCTGAYRHHQATPVASFCRLLDACCSVTKSTLKNVLEAPLFYSSEDWQFLQLWLRQFLCCYECASVCVVSLLHVNDANQLKKVQAFHLFGGGTSPAAFTGKRKSTNLERGSWWNTHANHRTFRRSWIKMTYCTRKRF